MNTNVTKKKSFNHKLTLIYLITNIVFVITIVVLLVCWKSFSEMAINLSQNSNNTITILLSIITVIATVELTIKQLFFRSNNKKAFLHVGKYICSLSIFVFLLTSIWLSNNDYYDAFCYLYSLCYSVITLSFSCFDIVTLNMPKYAKKELDLMTKKIISGQDTDDIFENIQRTLKEAVVSYDYSTYSAVLDNITYSLREYLKAKYKLQNNGKDIDSSEVLIKYFALPTIGVSLIDKKEKTLFVSKILQTKCEMVDEVLNYNNEDLNREAFFDLDYFIFNFGNFSRYVNYFVACFLENENKIQKKIDYLQGNFIKILVSKNINCEEVFERIISFYKAKKTTFSLESYKNFFSNFQLSIEWIDNNPFVIKSVLENMWELADDDDKKDVFKKFILMSRESDFFVKPTYDNYLGIHLFLKKAVNNCDYLFAKYIYEVSLVNTRSYIVNSNEVKAIKFLPLTKEHLSENKDEYIDTIYLCVKNLKFQYIHSLLEPFSSFSKSLTKSDRDTQIIIIEMLENVLMRLNDVESKDKVNALVSFYVDLIDEWDRDRKISKELLNKIIDGCFDVNTIYLESVSPFCAEAFELLDMFCRKKTMLSSFNNDKSELYKTLSSKCIKLAISSIEYDNKIMVKKCSDFIGWTLFNSSEDTNINVVKYVYDTACLPLLRLANTFNCDNNTVYFISTLFVVNFTKFISGGQSDPLFSFALNQINNSLSFYELTNIQKSIELRAYETVWSEYINDFTVNVSKLKKILGDKIADLKSNRQKK